MKHYVTTIFKSYAEIFFVQNYKIGIIIVAMTLINPHVALSGMLAVLTAHGFARFIGMDRKLLTQGFYTYNPLLVGMSIGYLFTLTPLTMLFVMTGAVLALIITIALTQLFFTYLKLPVLSLPFVFVSTIVYLASLKYTNLPANTFYISDALVQYLPLWLAGYFKSLGTIFFMPQVLPGIVMALGILVTSRILFLLSAAGYVTGAVFSGLMIGSFTQAFADVNHFNSILVAMAIGGIYLIPSWKSYILALSAVCVATMLLHGILSFWAYSQIPGFTLAFNIISLSVVYVLGVIRYPQLTQIIKRTPEETLDFYLFNQNRSQTFEKTLMLPFSGKWTIWQGFNGQWTHQGEWKHAYDFVVTDEQGRTYRNGGNTLNDYYAYRKPVLSPVRGRIMKVVNNLPDNLVGQVDTENNWGNLVIIQDERGFFVELSHFARNSIHVTEGAWMERGTLLGLCGNSGYSPQPHIHIQVQLTAAIGAYTVPFSFTGYSNDNYFHVNEQPPEGTMVEPLYWNTQRDLMTSFKAGAVYQYEIFKDGVHIDDLNLTVKTAQDGTLYFDSGRGKLYFGKRDGSFFFYGLEGEDTCLKMMLLALPRFPLACRKGLKWSETFPIGMVSEGLYRAVAQCITSFSHEFAKAQVDVTCTQKNRIEGSLHVPILKLNKQTAVEWDELSGFVSLKVDNFELRRSRESGKLFF